MTISDLMTRELVVLESTTTAADAALKMKQRDIGDVIVCDAGVVCGIVTDRDIVVRAVAEGKNPREVRLSEICSRDLVTVAPTDTVNHAVKLMGDRALRRLPVVQDGRPIGIVSLGDLARDRDRSSTLGEISSAPPNN